MTAVSTTIMNNGPKIMPYHPPPQFIIRGPKPNLSDGCCANAHSGTSARLAAAVDIPNHWFLLMLLLLLLELLSQPCSYPLATPIRLPYFRPGWVRRGAD